MSRAGTAVTARAHARVRGRPSCVDDRSLPILAATDDFGGPAMETEDHTPAPTSAHTVDVFDPEFIRCPFPGYRQLRDRGGPTYLDAGKGFWLVTAHDQVREVVADVATFSSESGPLAATEPSPAAVDRMAAITPPEGLRGRVNTLLTLDPPGHTRNRRLISRAFTPASVARYEDLTRTICRQLIEAWQDDRQRRASARG